MWQFIWSYQVSQVMTEKAKTWKNMKKHENVAFHREQESSLLSYFALALQPSHPRRRISNTLVGQAALVHCVLPVQTSEYCYAWHKIGGSWFGGLSRNEVNFWYLECDRHVNVLVCFTEFGFELAGKFHKLHRAKEWNFLLVVVNPKLVAKFTNFMGQKSEICSDTN